MASRLGAVLDDDQGPCGPLLELLRNLAREGVSVRMWVSLPDGVEVTISIPPAPKGKDKDATQSEP